MPGKHDATLAALRAIDELRRQQGVVIREENGAGFGNYPVEFLSEELLSQFRSSALSLLITAARAETLGLAAQDTKIEAETLSLSDIMALSGLTSPPPLGGRPGGGQLGTGEQNCPHPSMVKKRHPDVVFSTIEPPPTGEGVSAIDSMALMLAKDASLLPALLRITSPPDWLRLSAGDLREYIDNPLIDIVETASASLPVVGAETAKIISFRSRYSASVHLALVVGTPEITPLVRVHSSCVTGDLLGSLRCDCGDQLKLAMEKLSVGGGILVYLHQEGRGIGITNKLRAYALQERGFDTYEANRMLGFAEDERDFSIAAAILRKLGVNNIRLLTNNPHKLAALEKAGIEISERVPLVAPSGKHNHGYLETKGKKAGHLF